MAYLVTYLDPVRGAGNSGLVFFGVILPEYDNAFWRINCWRALIRPIAVQLVTAFICALIDAILSNTSARCRQQPNIIYGRYN
jgi:hypothetical protein